MSGRPKRGPGRPRLVDTGISPTRCLPPTSPLTPDSEEGFSISEPKQRPRGRPRGPIKKTRVNAQSKLKSPIRAPHSTSSLESPRVDCDLDFKMEAAYSNAVDAMGKPLAPENIHTHDEIIPEDKLCAFCSCGPERRMYQGKLQLCAPTPGFNPFKKAAHNRQRQNSTSEPFSAEPADTGKDAIDDVPQPQPMVHRRGPGRPPGRGRKKGSVVIGLPFRNNGQALTADKCMFGSVREKDVSEVFEVDGSVWAHHCCASWSEGVCQLDSYDLVNVDKAVFAAMSERCSHCNRYGASVVCQVPRCGRTFHYPCAASAGAFQEIQTMTMLCPDHLEDAGRLGGVEAQCYLCGEAKDFSEMLFCTSCGRHYHGRCLDPAVDPTSLVRMSWQCPDCKVCQGCRQPGDDNKMLVCDLCDKGYHTYCLDPPMTTIPKTGWKCVGCRRCEDCGSNTPGGGPTSRWHRHYTVCDSCYQQRNKGLFCQICSRAYRQLSDVAMVQCETCEKWLHAECDNVTEDVYRKITAKKVSYFCPQCKENGEDHACLNHKNSLSFDPPSMNDVEPVLSASGEEDKRTLTSAAIGRITPSPMDEDLTLINSSLVNNLDDISALRPFDDTLMDSLEADSKLPLDEEMEAVMKPELDMFDSSASGLPDSPPTSDHTSETKLLSSSSYRGLGFTPPKTGGKRKLGPKLKSKTNSTPAKKKAKHGRPGRPPTKVKKQVSVQPLPGKENLSGVANAADNSTKEEETEGLHTTVVLFSSDDKFTTEQDMCLCCGSFGKGREGRLIACSQCGQSYHPYCVGVKVNKIILSKGWRCLDCTLCEGCGKGSDEARLLLCDSCDISYHTYCLDPPLEKVPQGGWKCKWCVSCVDCGLKTPGSECEWQSNYTQCGPCASKITCPVCNIKYNENDLMIQCLHCDRWLHGSCDKLLTEEEVDKAAEYGYHCLFCRPKTKRALVCMSGPPSPKATALHHYRPQFSAENHPPQPQAKPIHPCQRLTNHGIVEMKLSHDFGRGGVTPSGNQPATEIENFLLTDSGIKQMNRLKLSSYGRRKVKSKVKPKKMGLAGLDKMEPLVSPDDQGEPLKTFNFEEHLDQKNHEIEPKTARSKGAHRPGVGGFVVRGRGSAARKFVGRGNKAPGRKKGQVTGFPRGLGRQAMFGGSLSANTNFFAQQQSSLEAIMDSSSNDAWPEESDQTPSAPLQEVYPDWMQEAFFGKSLLNNTQRKKKPKQESTLPSAPTEGEEKALKDAANKNVNKKSNDQQNRYNVPNSQPYSFPGEAQMNPQTVHPGQQHQVGFSRSDQPGTSHHPVMGLEGSENWHGSNVEGLPTDPLSFSEEFPNPEALYRSLDMLTDDMSSTDCQNVNRVMEQDQPHLQDAPAQPNTSNTNARAPSSQPQAGLLPSQTRPQGDFDILSAAIDTLPHVDGQEVEDIFAGIELEMKSRDAVYSGVGNPGVPQQGPRSSNDTGRGHPPPYQPPHQELQPFQQGPHDPGLPHFDAAPASSGFAQFGQDRPGVRNQHSLGGGPPQYGFDGEHDFTKRTDLDLASDLPRERRRAPSPRTDPMKQQQKWQEDEKLGDTATISPVLYANLEHANLQKEYPDWPNRYRAIARLWRKLSVEQREPFRLKARDNRVRLKDQGKRLLLEQNKKDKGKPSVPEVPESPASEPMTPNPITHNPMQDVTPAQNQVEELSLPSQVPSNTVPEEDQLSVPSQQSNPESFLQSSFSQVAPSAQFQQQLEQPFGPTPLTPNVISSEAPPAPSTSYTPTSPMDVFVQPRMNAAVIPGGKGSRNIKSKKTKEDKEKDKEKRKAKLLIQQQHEREWKLLQQRRQLEQQRQQQQQQQETNLLRQEVKRTQQVKGLRALEDKKKKSPQKITRKQSINELQTSVGGDNQEPSNTFDTSSQQSPAVSMHSDDSFSVTSAPPLDTLDSTQVPDNMRERRASLPNLAMSHHGLENVRPLSPVTTTQDRPLIRPRPSSQQASQNSWNEWNTDSNQQDPNNPMWCNPSLNTQQQQTPPINDPKQSNFPNPVIARQNSRPHSSEEGFVPQNSQQHMPEASSHSELSFHKTEQPWKPNVPESQGPPVAPVLPKQRSEGMVMPPQEHPQGDMTSVPFHQQGVINDQQPLPHKQQDMSHQWHPNQPSQSGPTQEHMGMVHNIQQQPRIMPQNQCQPRLQHPDVPPPQSYEFQGWQEPTAGPTSMSFQQPQLQQPPNQQQTTMQHCPQPLSIQPMTSITSTQSQNLSMQQHQTQPGISQVPIQPGPPPAPAPPPPPLPPTQHPNAPISRQPPTDEQQQQQQLEMLQKQQREQLMRAQQQQFLQMQMQQQQHLLQQQQQQQQPPIAVQPTFARQRMNQVLNTKDMPEIESEEEHQERLRFLYRQRQLQKQHIQMQAQQTMFQQQWPGQGAVPGLMPTDPLNPQGMPQIRPQQSPDMMQQQLLMEYQRRMNQRHELGQQSVQFDKVIQDLQQQQGVPATSIHQPPPFLEVSHQRFALRHPNPGVQNPPIAPAVPGQVPVFGMDGQQLYRMQMQQQMLMQQQPQSQRLMMPKANVQPTASSKTNEVETNGKDGIESTKDNTENPPKAIVIKTEGNSENTANQKETKTSEMKLESSIDDKSKYSGNQKEQEQKSTLPNSEPLSVQCTVIKTEDTARKCSDETAAETSEKSEQNANTAKALEQVENKIDEPVGKDIECKPLTAESKDEIKETTAEANVTEETATDDNSMKNKPLSHDGANITKDEVPVATMESQPTTSQQPIVSQPRLPEAVVSHPMQPLSSGQATPMAPSVQQQALHQQLMAAQQSFFQMQQQRQIMMQQYQQFQQQLQQNQADPMIGAKLMTLQQQGQFLQQSMIQVWQQIQMLQKEIQSSAGFQPQQFLPQPSVQGPSPGPMQGQQWSQPPMADQQGIQPLGIVPQHPGMMNKPGLMPPGMMQQQADGFPSSSPSPKVDKPQRKSRKSRAKSKDTLQAQPSPLSGQEWMMSPQPPPAKPKGKGKKGKKQVEEPAQDPELQLQQQRLRQQILQQMEQRHRILQQQQPHSVGRENPVSILNHPEMSASPHDLGPPTPQTLDTSATQPVVHPNQQSITPTPYGPSPVNSIANSVQQPTDPHSGQQGGFSGSPSMGIMTPEQINLSTSQLMNNALGFNNNPSPQIGNPGSQGTQIRPPVTCSPKLQPLSHPIAPQHTQNIRPASQAESYPPRFNSPERFHQFPQQSSKIRNKHPVVQYVADNNPFSDDFQIPKVVQADKPHAQKPVFPEQEPVDELTSAKPEANLPAASLHDNIQDIASQIPDLDAQSNPSSIPEKLHESTVSASSENVPKTNANHNNASSELDSNVERREKSDTSKTRESVSLNDKTDEQPTEGLNAEGKKGVSSQALQKLESMVADMGSEEILNEQGEALDSDLCFDPYNPNADEEVATLCSQKDKDQQMVSICKSSSQANSVASLECHEEVPSFVSPVQDGCGDKSETKEASREASPVPTSSENNSHERTTDPVPVALVQDKDNTDTVPEKSQQLVESSSREAAESHLASESNPNQETSLVSSSELTPIVSLQSSLASSQEVEQPPVTNLTLSTTAETCTVTSSIVSGNGDTVSSVSSGVLGEHLQLPMETRPSEGDMDLLGQFNPQSSETTFSTSQTNPELTSHQPDHGGMLLSGRDPMLGAANPMLSSSSTTTPMLNPKPAPKAHAKTKPKAVTPKVKRARADSKSKETLKKDDILKKSLQEAKRQEYERKKREYEEQQRKKRELQKELRQQKAKDKEERKRQRLMNSPNKIKSKENHVQKVRKAEVELTVTPKDSSLPLCEPKLILTHALMHPYGTSPFNGQCPLKGSLGSAHVDNHHDYYAKFPTPSLDLVLKVNHQKTIVNGDIGADSFDTKDFHKFRDADVPVKKVRTANELVPGVVVPTAGLLTTNAFSVNSLSPSPENLQYVASSSPECDSLGKPQTPKLCALNDETNRNSNDSPVFSPINPLNVKREQLLTTSSCSGTVRPNDSTTADRRKDPQAAPQRRTGPSLTLDQDIDDLDSINVTLTLSPSSEIRVSETVASVAELIGCSPPRPSDIVIEPSWKSTGSVTTTVPTTSGGQMFPHPKTAQGLSGLSPKEVDNLQKSPYPYNQFSLASTKSEPQRKSSDGPFCRHCDVLIMIGVVRGPSDMTESSSGELREIKTNDSESGDANSDGTNYKMYNINVQADERRDCFCSEICLKQYYSPLEAGRAKSKTEKSESEQQTSDCSSSAGTGNITMDSEQDRRGSTQAEGLPVTSLIKIRRPSWKEEQVEGEIDMKRRREIKWRRWQAEDFIQKTKPDLTADEVSDLLEKYEAVFKPKDLPEDTRTCTLCSVTGDGDPEGPSRLLNLDVDVWVHLNCALWSLEVYETLNGALMNVESAIKRGSATECCVCSKTGATVVCNHTNAYNKIRCASTYHFGCALQRKCMFFKDKTMLCEEHKPHNENDHQLPSYAVFRKVFINRDEIQQIASMLRHNQENGGDRLQTLRIGSVVVKSLGQLLLHQLQTFHTRNAVYPVDFKTIRYYWSMKDVRRRCQYYCSVEDLNGMPSFTIRTEDDTYFKGISPKDAWNQILLPIQSLRKESDSLNLWPSYITGEDLFGLTEQYVLRIIESMPGVDYMQGYNMRYGPSPIMELPLAVNPTGSARSEPHVRSTFKARTRAIRNTSGSTASTSRPSTSRANAATPQQSTDDTNSPYMKTFVYSKASQYRKLKSEWRQNVVLGRSNIQGLGLFANREIEPNSMVIEYIGSIIRNEVANRKESIYESQNRGIYMFRMDTDAVIDATMAGGPARYINHSCSPNCVAEVVTFEKEQKIIIISNRKVERGEELTYDYKFDFEDDEHKISCLCGAPNCRKWMN